MKLLTTVLVTILGLSTFAAAQQKERVTTEAILMMSDTEFEKVLLLGVTKTNIFFVKNKNDMDADSKRLSAVESVYILEPEDYSEAMSLFEDRKYGEAYTKFGEVKERYKKLERLADNPHTLAGFYQLECLRKQFKTNELVTAVADYSAENMLRSDLLQQVEVYKFWEALNSKSWARLDRLAREWEKKRVPISQRAQIAFCHAQALEELKRPTDALNVYAVAMTADFTKSEEIVRKAAHNSLRIFNALPEVQVAIKQWETEDQNVYSKGYRMLVEANALARLYNKAGMGAGVDLPKAYAAILKCTPKDAKGL